MELLIKLLVVAMAIGFFAYHGFSLMVWTLTAAAIVASVTFMPEMPQAVDPAMLWLAFATVALPLNFPPLRRFLVNNHILKIYRRILPPMSRTEREALEAGSVWWDAELFSGKPDWKKLLNYSAATLTSEEQAFVDGPVEELCRMLDDWHINHERYDLPEDVWKFIKQQRFFGMIIPKEYGGLGFSALAHSTVVMKVSSRSVAAAVTIMVPNSLGPAELLLHYGTDAQKNHYLPRLAVGEEIPCFALTSPEAGSDAGSIPDVGIVCKGEYDGRKDVLGVRVTWDKRYITLGPVATLLGLAFKLYDPEHLLGDKEELGITCALIPTNHPGVNIGRRHYPLAIAFQNGPNSGKDVFIPIDWIIGGVEQAGNGWRMLMECLAAGRSISLPALSVGAAKFSSRAAGAYARVRKQFKMPIGHFEGIEEPLARIGGYTYMMDAARMLTAGALDQGEKPSVISAILKFNLTDRMRIAVNDAMDIQGGAGICLGPHNIFGKIYHAVPISITVEGANILTRSMIIFGQGAIRCHPFVLREMEAAALDDWSNASQSFDKTITSHIGFTISNAARSLFLGLSNARLAGVPMTGPTRRYYQQATRMSSAFALVSDVAMLTLGGALKRKEKLSGRLADVLSLLYLISATLKRYETQGRNETDLPLLQWACDDALYKIQDALDGIIRNFPNRAIAAALRFLVFPLGRRLQAPADDLGQKVARILLAPSAERDRLTDGIFVPQTLDEPLGRLETTINMADRADALEKKLYKARKQGAIHSLDLDRLVDEGVAQGIIDAEDAEFLHHYIAIQKEVIKVDDFDAKLGQG